MPDAPRPEAETVAPLGAERPLPPFREAPYYEPLLDSLIHYTKDVRSAEEYITPYLSVFRSVETGEIVGAEISGLREFGIVGKAVPEGERLEHIAYALANYKALLARRENGDVAAHQLAQEIARVMDGHPQSFALGLTAEQQDFLDRGLADARLRDEVAALTAKLAEAEKERDRLRWESIPSSKSAPAGDKRDWTGETAKRIAALESQLAAAQGEVERLARLLEGAAEQMRFHNAEYQHRTPDNFIADCLSSARQGQERSG